MKSLIATTIGTIVSVRERGVTAVRERGATAVEYGIIVALIAAVIITAVSSLGGNVSSLFKKVSLSV